MRFLRLKLPVIIPLLAGIATLFTLPLIKPFVQFEQSFFAYPERFQEDRFFSHFHRSNHFVLESVNFEGSEEPRSIAGYLIDDESRDILGGDELGPSQWAYLLNHISKGEEGLIVVSHALSWSEAEEIPLRALEYEVNNTPNLVIGLAAEFNNNEGPLPPYLENSVITNSSGGTFKIPEIDHIPLPPSINAPLFGISSIKGSGFPGNSGSETTKVPMLVRWGKHILPTTHLASLIAAHQLKPSQVIIEPSGYLRLGKSGSIVRINSEGIASFSSASPSVQSASLILTKPDQTSSSKTLLSPDSPEFDQLLASHVPEALAQQPKSHKLYRRWNILIEIALLIGLTLLLQLPRKWPFIAGALLLVAGSIAFSHWFLILPILTLGLASALLAKLNPNLASPSKNTEPVLNPAFEAEPETEAAAEAEPEPETEAKPKPETEPEPVQEPEPASESEAEPEPKPVPEPKVESRSKPKGKTKAAAPAKKAAIKKKGATTKAKKAPKKSARKKPKRRRKKKKR